MEFSKSTIAAAAVTALSSSMVNAFATQLISPVANDTMQKTKEVVSGTWITSRVKSSLIVNRNVSGVNIKAKTNEGVVSLSDNVKSDAERGLAIGIVKGIKGVETVSADSLKSVEQIPRPNDPLSLVTRRKTDEFRCDQR